MVASALAYHGVGALGTAAPVPCGRGISSNRVLLGFAQRLWVDLVQQYSGWTHPIFLSVGLSLGSSGFSRRHASIVHISQPGVSTST